MIVFEHEYMNIGPPNNQVCYANRKLVELS